MFYNFELVTLLTFPLALTWAQEHQFPLQVFWKRMRIQFFFCDIVQCSKLGNPPSPMFPHNSVMFPSPVALSTMQNVSNLDGLWEIGNISSLNFPAPEQGRASFSTMWNVTWGLARVQVLEKPGGMQTSLRVPSKTEHQASQGQSAPQLREPCGLARVWGWLWDGKVKPGTPITGHASWMAFMCLKMPWQGGKVLKPTRRQPHLLENQINSPDLPSRCCNTNIMFASSVFLHDDEWAGVQFCCSSLVCCWAWFMSMLKFLLRLVVRFMFAFVLAIDTDANAGGCHGRTHLAWLGKHSQGRLEVGYSTQGLCCCCGDDLPAVHGESLGELAGGVLTWAPIPSNSLRNHRRGRASLWACPCIYNCCCCCELVFSWHDPSDSTLSLSISISTYHQYHHQELGIRTGIHLGWHGRLRRVTLIRIQEFPFWEWLEVRDKKKITFSSFSRSPVRIGVSIK